MANREDDVTDDSEQEQWTGANDVDRALELADDALRDKYGPDQASRIIEHLRGGGEVEPTYVHRDDGWIIEEYENVHLACCPDCAFSFDAGHIDTLVRAKGEDTYTCPACAEREPIRRAIDRLCWLAERHDVRPAHFDLSPRTVAEKLWHITETLEEALAPEREPEPEGEEMPDWKGLALDAGGIIEAILADSSYEHPLDLPGHVIRWIVDVRERFREIFGQESVPHLSDAAPDTEGREERDESYTDEDLEWAFDILPRFLDLPVGARFDLWDDRWEKVGPGAAEVVTGGSRGDTAGLRSLNPYCRNVDAGLRTGRGR